MILRAAQQGEVLIFKLDGQLDFETTRQFEEKAIELIEKHQASQIVFNFGDLKFVGSSGIHQFIKVLKAFNASPNKPRLCHLSSEFQKIFRAYQTARSKFEIFDSEKDAIASFAFPLPVAPEKPKKIKAKKDC